MRAEGDLLDLFRRLFGVILFLILDRPVNVHHFCPGKHLFEDVQGQRVIPLTLILVAALGLALAAPCFRCGALTWVVWIVRALGRRVGGIQAPLAPDRNRQRGR